MSENKTGKYLKYAIGEIVLVVIGILIALQINNWNQTRIEKIKSREYHQQIIENLDLLILSMTSEVRRSAQVKTYIIASLKILEKGELNKQNKDTLDFTFKNYNQFLRIDGYLQTIEEMKSSGQLGLIYNKELKRDIDLYLVYLSTVSKAFDQSYSIIKNDEAIQKHIYIQIEEEYRDNKIIYDFKTLKQDQLLKNKLSNIANSWQIKNEVSKNFMNSSKELKVKIKRELDK